MLMLFPTCLVWEWQRSIRIRQNPHFTLDSRLPCLGELSGCYYLVIIGLKLLSLKNQTLMLSNDSADANVSKNQAQLDRRFM